MRARLKELHSPDVQNLEEWLPAGEAFGFLLQAMIGPSDGEGMESFDLTVCSPHWLTKQMENVDIRSCEHTVLIPRYNYLLLRNYLDRRIAACEADNWPELATKLGQIGRWEFEDYQSRP